MLQYQTIEKTTLGLLKSLMSKDYIQQFVLVGGTALALQIGQRKSIDLDLFTIKDFDADILYRQVEEDFNITKITLKLKQTLIVDIDGVKVDFIRFKYPFQQPLILEEGTRILSIADIAPMKLDAVSGRGSKKDFYDIYFLFKYFSLSQLLELHEKMYQHGTMFHVIRSLTYFEDAEEDANPILFDKSITWNKVKTRIKAEVKKL